MTFFAADSFEQFEGFESRGNGKGHHPIPVVPEPAAYGMSLLSLVLIICLAWKRYGRSLS